MRGRAYWIALEALKGFTESLEGRVDGGGMWPLLEWIGR